jgi:hypothetical protein
MEPKTIDDQIRGYYADQRLSEAARARLKSVILAGRPQRRSDSWWWLRASLAAVFILGTMALALWFTVFREPDVTRTPHEIAAGLAQQAALGQNTRQELEVRVADCTELRAKMKSLDFTPVEPIMMREMNMRIVGARYATIEGKMAVQIVFVDSKGVPCTLYEVRPGETLARLPKSDHQVDGVQVSVWQEKGLLMVLARPMA